MSDFEIGLRNAAKKVLFLDFFIYLIFKFIFFVDMG